MLGSCSNIAVVAADPTTPHGGRATNMSLQDAFALGRCYREHGPEGFLEAFQTERRDQTTGEVLPVSRHPSLHLHGHQAVIPNWIRKRLHPRQVYHGSLYSLSTPWLCAGSTFADDLLHVMWLQEWRQGGLCQAPV